MATTHVLMPCHMSVKHYLILIFNFSEILISYYLFRSNDNETVMFSYKNDGWHSVLIQLPQTQKINENYRNS